MNTTLERSLQYLCPPSNGFWEWSAEGDSINWRSGEVIVFRSELAAILEPYVSRGLPGLDGLLLVIAATRENWPLGRRNLPNPSGLDRLFEQRERSRLTTVQGRQTLIDTLFEDRLAIIDRTAARVVSELLRSPTEEIRMADFARYSAMRSHHWMAELAAIETRLERVEPASFLRRLTTGVESDIGPADLQLALVPPTSPSIQTLLKQLEEHTGLQGIALVARQLIAALSLPRAVSQLDEHPHGGVSDICNRGSLDRLLVSELANDDMTLTTRIALNEAMYLRREQPPQSIQSRRLVLLDCGIRQWGVPRIFATSVALALAYNKSAGMEVSVHHACGDELQAVDLSGVEELFESFHRLRYELHLGDALPWVQEVVQGFAGEMEVVLVTSPEGASDPAFCQALADANIPSALFLVTVERSGRCELWQLRESGRNLLKAMTIDLAAISHSSLNLLPLVDKKRSEDLPAIVKLDILPLRVGDGLSANRYWCSHTTTYCIASDRRLLAWNSKEYGALQLSDRVPIGEVVYSFQTAEGVCYAVLYPKKQSQPVCLIGVTPWGQVTDIHLQLETRPHCFFYYCGTLVAVFANNEIVDSIASLDLESGRVLHSQALEPSIVGHPGQRFFRRLPGGAEWFAVLPDATGFRVIDVPLPVRISKETLVLFETEGVDGPIALLATGDLYFVGDEKRLSLQHVEPPPFKLLELGSHGRKILVGSVKPRRPLSERVCIDVLGRTCAPAGPQCLGWLEASQRVHERSKRNYFRAVQYDSQGRFLLQVRSGKLMELMADASGIRLRECPAERPSARAAMELVPFESCPPPDGVGYQLGVASLSGGSRLFLDSRGMLHLKSSNPTIPEATLVLTNGNFSGWNADGRLVGDAYYLGTSANQQPEDFFRENVSRFVEEVLTAC